MGGRHCASAWEVAISQTPMMQGHRLSENGNVGRLWRGFERHEQLRFLCRNKAGGRKAPSHRATPPRNAGRGAFSVGGRDWTFVLCEVVDKSEKTW